MITIIMNVNYTDKQLNNLTKLQAKRTWHFAHGTSVQMYF